MNLLRWKCRSVRHELWDFAADRLSEGPMERVERHLDSCTACRMEVDGLRRAHRMLEGARRQMPPSCAGWTDLKDRLAAEGLASPLGGVWMAEPPAARQNRQGQLALVGGFAAVLLVSLISIRTLLPAQKVVIIREPLVAASPVAVAPSVGFDPLRVSFPESATVAYTPQSRPVTARASTTGDDVEETLPVKKTATRLPGKSRSQKRNARRTLPREQKPLLADHAEPKASDNASGGLTFRPHTPTAEEQAVEPQGYPSRERYVMQTLTPVSNTDDNSY